MKQYSYKATSNLVLEQERSRRRSTADTGEVAPLRTDELEGQMGDKAARRPGETSADLAARREKKRKNVAQKAELSRGDAVADIAQIGRIDESRGDLQTLAGDANVVDIAEELELDAEGGRYVPTTQVSKTAFEALLAFIMSKLGDQPRDLLRGAAEETLVVLKDQQYQESERKKIVEDMLAAKMSVDEFSRLSMFGRQIEDFQTEAERAELNTELEDSMGEDQAVAVVFDDDDVQGGSISAGEGMEEELDMRDLIDVDERNHLSTVSHPGNFEKDDDDALMHPNASDEGMLVKEQKLVPLEVDGYWLQRTLSQFFSDADECHRVAEEVLKVLSGKEDDRYCENQLVILLGFDKFDFVSLVMANRFLVVFCTQLARAKGPEERSRVEEEMKSDERGLQLLELLRLEDPTLLKGREGVNDSDGPQFRKFDRESDLSASKQSGNSGKSATPKAKKRKRPALRNLDLESLAFKKGGHLMTVRDCKLPEGSEHIENKDYDEWHIPAVKAIASGKDKTISIQSLPNWCQPVFPGTRHLNRMQSSVFPCAFGSDENMLLCAPTGAGKTNVAVLTILRAIQNSGPPQNGFSDIGEADLAAFKVVYVAPMKALVAEVVENLGRRLKVLGLSVRELTGDVNLSKQEIEDTQVIVTTPEKWDIVTRKSRERAYTSLVRLLIIDEIHLLHDERGPVLETIVARTLRNVQSWTTHTRIIGLSATLPNYQDVATFLHVAPDTGLFFYDSTHRPCPLQQCFVGVTTKKAMKRFQLMNDLTYDKVKEQIRGANQVIVFVHSRKETSNTCHNLISKAIDEEITDQFLKPGSASFEIIQDSLPDVNGKDLRELLEHGFATHHAGMSRKDRQLVEALFENGHVKVLVSTATLAWGVNLPAHAVIIKGTQVYSPEHGRWIELSSMDVMQMIGRAGRPQFDTYGEGIIITTKADVLFYLSLLNQQLPIESQFVARLVDMLNAEVAMGTVSSLEEGAQWLSYTYLYVRMLKNPTLYGIHVDELQRDPKLERRRLELVHAAAIALERSGLVKYSKKHGSIVGTDLGRVAADFYVGHETISMYVEHMRPTSTDIDLFRLLALSGEFRHIRVREEEKLELGRLSDRVPIPIKEALEDSAAKVNVLLQSYISNLSLDGLALKADMIYVTQSAARLARALLQVAIRIKCAPLMEKCLRLCKAVTCRQWNSQSPLRQFRGILADDVLHKIERKDISFDRYYDLEDAELGELLRSPKLGRTVHRLVHSLPRLEIDAKVRPISRSTLEIEVKLTPDFKFDRNLHRAGEAFWIVVEDSDSEVLLHSEPFYLRGSLASEEHVLSFFVKLTSPQPPQYFLKCFSDRWIVPETVLPVLFHRLLLPEKFAAHTKVLDMRPRAVRRSFGVDLMTAGDESVLDMEAYREGLEELRAYFSKKTDHFSALQTQMFPSLFESDENVVIASIPGPERFECAELCLGRLFTRLPDSLAVWIVGKGVAGVGLVCKTLTQGLGKQLNLTVGTFLSGGVEELRMLRTAGAVIVTTVERWDMFSRWRRQKRERKVFDRIGLVLLDGVQLMSGQEENGAALEIVGSRMRYLGAERGENAFRIVALSDPIANAKEVGHWLGCPPTAVFSFHPEAVDKGLRVEFMTAPLQSAGNKNSAAATFIRPVFAAIRKHSWEKTGSILVFAPSKKMVRGLALELVSAAAQSGSPNAFLSDSGDMMDANTASLSPGTLKDSMAFGVGFIYNGIGDTEKECIETLFRLGTIRALVASADYAWECNISRDCLVIVAGTSREDAGRLAVRRAEYSRTDLMKMMCCVRQGRNNARRVVVIITEAALLEHYKQHCLEPLPVESQLTATLSDHLNAEIAAKEIETRQEALDYLTWTFFYRRLPKNPNYYGLQGLSHIEISNHLSEIVDSALSELEDSKCVAAEGDEDVALGALNLGIIAAHFYIRHATVELFASSITPNTKLGGLLNILSLASELGDIPVRIGEEDVLKRISQDLPLSMNDGDSLSFSSPHIKVHILLQAHMNRRSLPAQLRNDQAQLLPTAVRLLRSMVDVISSAGWLKPAIIAVELSQMLIQGVWVSDPNVMQLPHIDKEIATSLKRDHDISEISELLDAFLDMEPNGRIGALQRLSRKEISEISSACQNFPDLQNPKIVSIHESEDNDGEGLTRVVVQIERNQEDAEEVADQKRKTVPLVTAPLYPTIKEEGWWVIVGDWENNSLLTLKYVSLKVAATVKLDFVPPTEHADALADAQGKKKLNLYILSDSYVLECDIEDTFQINVKRRTLGSDSGEENENVAQGTTLDIAAVEQTA